MAILRSKRVGRHDVAALPWGVRAAIAAAVAGVLLAGATAARLGAQSTVPGAPQNLSGTAVVDDIRLSWEPPVAGAPIIEYILEGGIQPGTYEAVLSVSTLTSLSFDVPDGVYYFRVSAVNAFGQGPPTPEVSVTVGVGSPVFPSAPQNLRAVVTGGTLSLNWTAPSSIAPVASYVLRAGTTPGRADIGTLPLGLETSYTTPLGAIREGIYYVRLSALNAYGEGPPSAEVRITVGPHSLPSAPQNLRAVVTGNTISLTWTAPSSITPIAGYVLRAGTTPGRADIGTLPLGLETSYTTPLAAIREGIYYVRVSALNAYGEGSPGAELRIAVGQSCTTPGPPTLVASKSGNVITAAWTTPPGGPISGYAVLVNAVAGPASLSTTDVGLVNAVSSSAGDGIYFVRVVAHALCGSGSPSNEIAITVP